MLYSGLSNKQPYETDGRRFSLDEKIAQIREFWKRKFYFCMKEHYTLQAGIEFKKNLRVALESMGD